MDHWLIDLLNWSLPGFMGALGGLAGICRRSLQQMRFNFWTFLASIGVAFFVGKVGAEFLPIGTQYRAGIIYLLGFFASPVLGLVEKKLLAWLDRFVPGSGGES